MRGKTRVLTLLFKSTVEDIFNKFDMLGHQELSYQEFKAFCDCVDYQKMNETEFKTEILDKFASTSQIENDS